jgi:hypothetical protein
MLTPPFSDLLKYMALRYASLGRPLKLAPMSFEFRVSNNLFEYSTTGGRFLLKVMAHPQALYGHQDVTERLEIVGQALLELHRAGLPVEEIMRGEEKRFVHRYQGHVLRLYRFNSGRGFADPNQDTRRSARSLAKLHTEGLSFLSEETRKNLARFDRAYPIRTTVTELPTLFAHLKEQAGTRGAYAQILAQWGVIEGAVERVLNYRPVLPDNRCLVHTDFHPRNVLFDQERDQAVMMDCDNMMIDRRLPCLAFSILRFAFFQSDRTTEALQETINLFTTGEERKLGFLDDLHHAMMCLEIEKVLRILHRVRTTGQYAGFIDNVCPIHLANIRFLNASVVCA